MNQVRVLVVDDDPEWIEIWTDELAEKGAVVESAANMQEAREKVRSGVFYEAAIVDKGGREKIDNPVYGYHDGLELVKTLREVNPACRIVIATGESFSRSVFEVGVNGFVDKSLMDAEWVAGYVSRGFLRPDEMGRPIQNFSGEGSFGIDPERR